MNLPLISERPDYYAALGVPRTASPAAIKAAYRRLVGVHHPDRHPGDPGATARLQVLVEAFQVLGDDGARSAYDSGRVVETPPIEPGTPVEELLGTVVDQLFGVRPNQPRDGRDISYRLTLALADVATGCTRALELPRDVPCAGCDGRGFPLLHLPHACGRCGGAGEIQRRRALRAVLEDCPACGGRGYAVDVPCPTCKGGGVVKERRKLSIEVPAGVEDGERLLVRGAGEPGRHGGKAGDCYVVIDVTPHPVLTRVGANLVLERPVSILDAIAGGWVSVPTVEGQRRVRLPAGTQDGTVLRMKGLGVGARSGAGGRGDQLVAVRVELPTGLTSEQRERVRALADELGLSSFPVTRAFAAAHLAGAGLPEGEK